MNQYTIVQWLFFIYLYSFAGWVWETNLVSLREKRFVNRGFMRGPFLPIYGTGGMLMYIFAMPWGKNIPAIFITGMLGATAFEFIVGVLMELLFKVRYWDYSNRFMNFRGHICLRSSLCWGVFTVVHSQFVHKFVERFVMMIPAHVLTIVTYVLTAAIFSDFALCFKAALDLRDLLERMEGIKRKMGGLQNRLEAITSKYDGSLGRAKDTVSSAKDTVVTGLFIAKNKVIYGLGTAKHVLVGVPAAKFSDLAGNVENRWQQFKERRQGGLIEMTEEEEKELESLPAEITRTVEEHHRLAMVRDYLMRSLIRSNPGMKSERYQEYLNEIRENVSKKMPGNH